jgi:hypothetical protein
MNNKPKILIILENFYGYEHGNLAFTTYGVGIVNRRNATYSRILPYLEPHFTLRFGETTPFIGCNRKEKFPVDLEWIEKTIKTGKWFAVIPACAKAKEALDKLGIHYDFSLPHPAGYAWRKALIEDCRDSLLKKLNDGTSI